MLIKFWFEFDVLNIKLITVLNKDCLIVYGILNQRINFSQKKY